MKDHREIGREMDLFMFSELSPGCPIWLPNGNTIYTILQDKIRAIQKQFGYVEVRTPMLWKLDLYRCSGHLEHYEKNMFFTQDGDDGLPEFALKPMNCPGHMEIYKAKGARSISELPLRMADQGVLHRNEVSGALTGLTRCRSFCQDDAHIFLTPDQIGTEIAMLCVMIQRVYMKLGMSVRSVLSTRPKNFMGEVATWDSAEENLRGALVSSHQDYTEEPGEGAFYGPKIDFYVKDSMGREWQTATVQLDFQLPERFNLEYTDHDNSRKRPVVVHRAVYGSFERFIGIVLEHYQGHLPTWLAPVQYAILPISDKFKTYAYKIKVGLENRGLRAKVDDSNNRTGQKVAVAQSQYVPNMVILGQKEETDGTVTVRDREGKNVTVLERDFYAQAMYANDFDFGFQP